MVIGNMNCWVSVSLSTADPTAANRAAYNRVDSEIFNKVGAKMETMATAIQVLLIKKEKIRESPKTANRATYLIFF